MKDFLEEQGYVGIIGSKNAAREAFAAGVVADGEVWMKMVEHRNQTSHTYNEKIAGTIVEAILASYVPDFAKFHQKFAELERKQT